MEFQPIYCITINMAILLSVYLLVLAQYNGWLADIKKSAAVAIAVTLLAAAACPPVSQLPVAWLAAATVGAGVLFNRLSLRLMTPQPVEFDFDELSRGVEYPIEFEEITQCE